MKNLLFRNWSLKILSFFFAVSLWLFVNLKATTERTYQIPVRWKNLPNFLAITNEVNDSVRVRMSGPGRILTHFDPSKHPVTLDLSDAKVGLSNYQINEKMIERPPGLTATVLPPDTIQFKFELVVTREVDVRPRVLGPVAEGYVLEKVEAAPARIEIVGAQSEVQVISEVGTEPVDVRGRTHGFEKEVKISLDRPHVWPSTGQGLVTVRVMIAEKLVEKLFRGVPLRVENGQAAFRLERQRVDVVLEGPARKLRDLRQDQVVPSVVLPREGSPPGSLPVRIQLPVDGIRAKSIPERVRVVTVGPSPGPGRE